MDNSDLQSSKQTIGLAQIPSAFPPELWGSDALNVRSRDLSPLYAIRYIGPRGDGTLSSHPFWEISFVFRGKGSMIGRTQTVPMTPHAAVVIPPGIEHREESPSTMDTIWIGLEGLRLSGLPDSRMWLASGPQLAPIVELLWLRGRVRTPGVGLELDGLAHTLVARLMQLASTDPSNPPDHKIIDDAIRYLHTRLDRPISVPTLAARANLSHGHFHRLFKTRTGFAPIQYLNRLRVETASQLLRESNLPIKRIAQLVGFSDPLYFSRVYRRITGKPPKRSKRVD